LVPNRSNERESKELLRRTDVYKGSSDDLPAIAKQLGVANIVTISAFATYTRRFSAQRYRRPLFSEASSVLERIGDLEDSEIVAISTNDLDADRLARAEVSTFVEQALVVDLDGHHCSMRLMLALHP
jgi:hypothetical protein